MKTKLDELDRLYATLDDMLLAGEFSQVDVFLEVEIQNLPDPEYLFNLDMCLTVLTATAAAKNKLIYRDAYYQMVEGRMMDEDIEPEEILFGLD